MYYLYTASYNDLGELFGRPEDFMPHNRNENQKTFLNQQDFDMILIGQDQRPPEENSYSILFLAKKSHEKFNLQNTIPDGYTFVYRQEWGLSITPEILHRVISNLRKESYPPIEDYLDAKVKGDVTQENDYLAKCLAVKAKYPKLTFI
jgi:hypothetical protein